ncbi:TetR/AcrR family transcriptional regulator [Nocardioides anomalus]|uniref:TetR/AcrR family transcriptional regulator n=1 Tax=Nocardioides anomalus TaxID=2712223 RepID=A0A6G6WEL9_9ACTN|nr:TetR/AcrR family transcriptional regulator [Nocardioides anomalus]QIG43791.1 TetR/AcrR family transcriptional regulator [Nocardioides anomalus]
MVGLSAKGAATRERIVSGAAELLRTEGIVHTTLDDVLARTRTSKGQLFHYFPGGREELLLAVAELEAARVLSDQEPHLSDLTSWAAWQDWRDAVVARYVRQGPDCPLHAVMTQVATGTPGSHAVVVALMSAWEGALRTGVEAMQAAGEVAPEVDAAAAARALVATVQGGVQVLMATGDAGHLEAGLDLALAGLRPRGSG